MWKDSDRNIVVIFQTNILRIVGFYVRHSAPESGSVLSFLWPVHTSNSFHSAFGRPNEVDIGLKRTWNSCLE